MLYYLNILQKTEGCQVIAHVCFPSPILDGRNLYKMKYLLQNAKLIVIAKQYLDSMHIFLYIPGSRCSRCHIIITSGVSQHGLETTIRFEYFRSLHLNSERYRFILCEPVNQVSL